jgi:hypothetical protein
LYFKNQSSKANQSMENQPVQQAATHAGPTTEGPEGSFGANPLQLSAFDGGGGGATMKRPIQRVEQEGGMCVDLQGTVTAEGLRVRSKPGTQYPEITDPILRGTAVHVTASENGWYQINPNRWVFAQYVDTQEAALTSPLQEPNMSVATEGGVDTSLVIVLDEAELAAIQGRQVADFTGELNLDGLTGDVGKNSANDPIDVATVQTLLNRAGAGIQVNGVCDRVVEGAIYMHQKGRGVGRPDAVVSQVGGTWDALVAGEFQFSSIDGFVLDTEDLAPEGIPVQDDVEAEYGDVDNIPLTRVSLPFPLYYDGSPVSTVSVHEDVAGSLTSALSQVLSHYGLEEIERLRISHNYGGSYNKRKMRGGSSWSMHAYGIAIDMNAAENGLRTTASAALFAKPEYEPFLDIMERNGWYSLGRAKNYDYMHFQTAYPV